MKEFQFCNCTKELSRIPHERLVTATIQSDAAHHSIEYPKMKIEISKRKHYHTWIVDKDPTTLTEYQMLSIHSHFSRDNEWMYERTNEATINGTQKL